MKDGNEAITIMNWDDIRFLSNHPLITIGSHVCQHISIGKSVEMCYEEEYAHSKNVIEIQLGIEVNYFAYPYGQYKDIPHHESNDFFKKLGYKAYLTTNWSRKNSNQNTYKLNRLEMLDSYNVEYLNKILNRLLTQDITNKLSKIIYTDRN